MMTLLPSTDLLLVAAAATLTLLCVLGVLWLRASHRRRLPSPARVLAGTAVVLVLGVAAGFTFNAYAPASDTVTLPVEVIGPDGHTVTVQVNASDVSNVDRLYIRAHSIGYPYHIAEGRGFSVDKASIRLNGGNWYDINNGSVNCKKPESTIRCIDGPMHTVRFSIPVSNLGSLSNGSNAISFRYNYAKPNGELGAISTGFRILDIELQTSGGADQIDGTTFVWDDPGTWSAPSGYDTNSDVQDGAALWNQRDLLVEGWGGPNIVASCADCHVKNGYDLEYFAYSNESIVQRSRYHGLSEAQGKKIAAYIRSVDIRTEDGTVIAPPGRPWNPPYQPGPTSAGSRADDAPRESGTPIDDLPAVYWAAGAGAEWALESDREMKDFLFPGGITPDDIATGEVLNARHMPVAVQMPDWNEWLPAVHPMDVWGSEFTSSDLWQYYNSDVLDAHDTNDFQRVEWATKNLWKDAKKNWRRRPGPGTWGDNPDKGVAGLGVFQWAITKTFELLQPNHFENDARSFYGPTAEPLQWPSSSRIVFDQAPHILGAVKGDDKSAIMDVYHDTAWYQHAITINPGSAISTSLKPVDWKYHYAHLSAVQQYGAHSYRYLFSYAKLLDVAESVPEDWSADEPKGYYMRHLTPGVIDIHHFWGQFIDDGLTDDEYRRALNVILKKLGDGLSDEDWSNWTRTTGSTGIEPEDFWPQYLSRYDKSTSASHFWTALQNFGEYGVAYEVLKPLAEWSQTAWPRRDWLAHIDPYKNNPGVDYDNTPANAAPSVRITAPTGGVEYTAPSSVALTASASDSDGSIASVEFFVDGTSLKVENVAPYEADWSSPAPGVYSLTAVATDDQGASTTSDPVSVTIYDTDGSLPAQPGIKYAYYEAVMDSYTGIEGLTPTATGVTNTISTAERQRDSDFAFRFTGFIKIPASDTYTFYTNSNDGSGLWIDGQQVVQNDGYQAATEKSGQIQLDAGFYPIRVDYFQAGGNNLLEVRWQSSSLSKQIVPDANLYPTNPEAVDSRTIPLAAGWNLISSPVAPSDPSIDQVLTPARENVVLVKDEDGMVYSEPYGIEDLSQWNTEEGYMLYTETADTLHFEGQRLSPSQSLDLEAGWNYVAVLPDAAMPVTEAFGSLGDALVIAKNYLGEVYMPSYGINEIGDVMPLQSYRIYVSSPATLTYPTASKTASSETSSAASKAQGPAASAVASSATLVIDAAGLDDGTALQAVAAGTMVGTGTVQEGRAVVTVRGYDRMVSDVPGARTGEELTLRTGSDAEALTVDAVEPLFGDSNRQTLRFQPDAVLKVQARAELDAAFALERNVPNPVRSQTRVTYQVAEESRVTLSVYNVLGQRVATVVDATRRPGRHEAVIDVSRFSSGVYFYRLQAGSFRASKKMTVVR